MVRHRPTWSLVQGQVKNSALIIGMLQTVLSFLVYTLDQPDLGLIAGHHYVFFLLVFKAVHFIT